VQGDALCGRRVMLRDVRAQGEKIVNGFRRPLEHHWSTTGASYPLGRGTLFAGLPGRDPFADACMRDALAAIER